MKIMLLIFGVILIAGPAKAQTDQNTAAQYFDQWVNPSDNQDQRTFKQRYWINSAYAKDSDAPVLYFICGEDNCSDQANESSSVPQLAQALNAHIIKLEHRYYGESILFSSLSGENLKYLTIENEIKDLARFQKAMSPRFTGKWIALGGSYAANLAATYRQKHPELVAGAIASSACPMIDDTSIVNDQLAADVLGLECTAQYRSKVLTPILGAIGNPLAMKQMKALFHAPQFNDDLDFLGSVTGMVWFKVILYGAKDVCSAVASQTPLDSTALVINDFMKRLDSPLVGWSFQGMAGLDASLYKEGLGMRQNMYQGCTEMGLYNAVVIKANPDTRRSILSTLTDSLPAKYCDILFGVKSPLTNEVVNQKYYTPLLNSSTSQILFLNGSNDAACLPSSISHENGNDTNPNTTAFTIQGGSHCSDLRKPSDQDSASLKTARDLKVKMIKDWIRNSL